MSEALREATVHFPFLAGGVRPHSRNGDHIFPAGNAGAVRIPSLVASPHLGQLPRLPSLRPQFRAPGSQIPVLLLAGAGCLKFLYLNNKEPLIILTYLE